MNYSNKVYSGHWSGIAIVGGVGLIANFEIPLPARQAKLKSLLLDMHFEINAAAPDFFNVPEDSALLRWWLDIGSGVLGDQITNAFVPVGAGLLVLNMFGEMFRLFKSRQYLFESFFIQNVLPMTIYVANLDILNQINVCATVVIELDDIRLI